MLKKIVLLISQDQNYQNSQNDKQDKKFQNFQNWFFKNCFEVSLDSPTDVRKQVLLISCSITTIPGGWVGGRPAGEIENKAN